MMSSQENTKERIKAAAWDVFVEKGRDGARMQEIADRAGANKAMIYYYFTSKDILFEEIIKDIFKQLISNVKLSVFKQDHNPEDIVRIMVDTYIDLLENHPYLPRVMTRELLSENPIIKKIIKSLFETEGFDLPTEFVRIIILNSQSGNIRQVDPIQTILSFLGMCLFYFIAKPVIVEVWGMQQADEEEFIKKRKEAITDLILNGILPR